jgi:hypothetical protein
MVAVRCIVRPFSRVRPQRDVINNPASSRQGSRGRVSGRGSRRGRGGGFGRVSSSVQGDTPVD